jgi:phosphohistidine phosphatase
VEPRRLVLIRHAKAAGAPVDADRPLTEAGARHAAAIGAWLAQAGMVPDRVLVSPARRTVQTWEHACGTLTAAPAPVLDPRIYDNTVESLLAVVQETADDVRTLAVVGHNPSIGELAADLDDGRGDLEARDDLQDGFPTGAVAVFMIATPFAELAAGAATLDRFAVPGD